MNKNIIKVLLLVLITTLFFSGCGKKDDQVIVKEKQIISVTSEVIETKDIKLTTYAIGKLSPKATYNAVALSPGEVVETYFEIGDNVKKDDILFVLDKEDFDTNKSNQLLQLQISLNQVKISLDDAKKVYEDNLKLFNVESISKNTLDRSKSQYDQSQLQYNNIVSQINAANDNLNNQEENLVVKSPIDGLIASKTVEKNMYVTSQNGYTIIKNNPIIFNAGVVEKYINNIKVGQKTEVFISALNKKVEGTVKSISLLKKGTTYPIEIEINNSELQIKPDMYAEVNIEYDILKNSIVIPNKAILEDNSQSYIYLLADKVDNGYAVKKVNVEIIGLDNDIAYIANSEMLNKIVIVEGSSFIDEKSIVKIK
jgi:cobalt-zinc-cadmium efflux system membrane fusion protein